MRELQASEAKAHLLQLLDDVQRGETLIITRQGRAIARICPRWAGNKRKLTRPSRVSAIFESGPAKSQLRN